MHQREFIEWWLQQTTCEPFTKWVQNMFVLYPDYVTNHDALGCVLMGGEL